MEIEKCMMEAFHGTLVNRDGITAELLKKNGIAVITENEI